MEKTQTLNIRSVDPKSISFIEALRIEALFMLWNVRVPFKMFIDKKSFHLFLFLLTFIDHSVNNKDKRIFLRRRELLSRRRYFPQHQTSRNFKHFRDELKCLFESSRRRQHIIGSQIIRKRFELFQQVRDKTPRIFNTFLIIECQFESFSD